MRRRNIARVFACSLLIAGCGDVVTLADAARPDARIEPSGPRTWQPELALTEGPGESWTTYNFLRVIAADDAGRVHGVYHGDGRGRDDVYYRRSTDAGATFEAAVRLTEGALGGEDPSVAAAGDHVYVAWHDDFVEGATTPRAVLRRSVDGGATFGPEVVIAAPPQGAAHPSLAVSGDAVHVAWGDHRDGASTEIYHRASHDGGDTFEAPQRISETPYESWVPAIAVDGDLVVIGWVDYRDANEEEYFRRSTDGGRTFEPIERLTDDVHDSWAPSLAIEGDTVHFFWFDRRDAGIDDAELETEIDAILTFMGLTPEAAPAREASTYYLHELHARIGRKLDAVAAEQPTFAAAGGDLMALMEMLQAFHLHLAQWENGWELYFRRSLDRGASFEPATRLSFSDGLSQRPSVGVLGDEVHVAWFDGRHEGGNEIYYRRSPDRGLSWDDEVRLTNADGDSRHAGLAVNRSGVHVLYYDERSGGAQVYYRRAIVE